MVPIARNKPKLFGFLDACFLILKTEVKVHGFGMTGPPLLKRYPFYSVDSTSWLGGSMRSEVYFYDPSKGDIRVTKTKDRERANHNTIGFNDDNDKRWFQRVIHNAIEWQKYEKFLTELWKKRGIVWEN